MGQFPRRRVMRLVLPAMFVSVGILLLCGAPAPSSASHAPAPAARDCASLVARAAFRVQVGQRGQRQRAVRLSHRHRDRRRRQRVRQRQRQRSRGGLRRPGPPPHIWGGPGDGDKQFDLPRGLAFSEGDAADSKPSIYVVDSSNFRIQKFGLHGAFVTKWGTNGSAPGQFGNPTHIAVGPWRRVRDRLK